MRLETVEATYDNNHDPFQMDLDMYIMRLHHSDQPVNAEIGAMLHFEPEFDDDELRPNSYSLTSSIQRTPLSDYYYDLVQNSYYTLGHRNINEMDIGQHVMDYMAWSTYLPDQFPDNAKG